MDKIFKRGEKEITALSWDAIFCVEEGRKKLGEQMPVSVYRMFEYSMRNALTQMYGKESMIKVFRMAGEEAGQEFYKRYLDGDLMLNDFLAQLQQKLLEYSFGMLRVEKFDVQTGHAVLTVSEDLDCSGLPVSGETVCNYDEGFIAGILKAYTQKDYVVTEVDCWATGDTVCRFDARVVGKGKA